MTTQPVIGTGQNGSGATLTTAEHYNSRGLLVKTVDQRGTVTEYIWDEARGGITSKTEDKGTGKLNLITDYVLDDRGRTVLTLGPAHESDIGGTPTSIRSARWTYFKDAENGRWTFGGYRTTAATPVDQIVGPVTIEQSDIAPPPGVSYSGWRQSSTVQAQYTGTGIPSPDASFPRSSWLRWSLSLYDRSSELRESRSYFDIPAEGYGARSENYARSLYGYDSVGRRNQTVDPCDTVDQTTYNAMGWAVTQKSGVLIGAQTYLSLIRANQYDDDGNLTQTTLPVDSTSANDRVADMTYDWRNRRVKQTTTVEKDGGGTWTLITAYTYDYRGQATAVTGYHTLVADDYRTSRQTSAYDDLGRLYRSEVYGVSPSGVLSDPLISNRYHNELGLIARDAPAGSKLFTATAYDAVGRTILVSQAYEPSGYTPGSDPASLANAVVMEQRSMKWDNAGNLTATTTKQRFNTATGNGNLGDPSTEPKARVSYKASYPDALGRSIASADFGTNGASAWTRPPAVPARSDTVLVHSSSYSAAGDVAATTDPAGVVTANTYDDAGRLLAVVENSTGGTGNTRTTRYEYADDNGLEKLVSQNPDTGEQITEWTRGVTTGQGSALNSNRLVCQKRHPDSTGSPDLVSYTYSRQSQVTGMADQAGTFHAYTYDKLGRLLRDAVTFPAGSALDTAVGRLETGYNVRGLIIRSTSLNPAGDTILNEVKSAYNEFNQLVTEWQEHFGAVNTSTSRKVQYTYDNGSANTIRPTGITNPDGTHITTGYSSGMGDAISRPDLIEEGSSTLASMKYLGLGTPVELKYDSAGGALWTMKNATTGDIYTGLDRFGRLAETIWKTSSAELVHTKYGRNRVGGVVWQRNALAHSMSPEVKTQDHFYAYDALQQVKLHQRGNLWPPSGPPYTGVADLQQQEDFVFDETGNWLQYVSNAPTLDQHRTHDKANQITSLSHPVGVVQPAYDPVGNMTRMPKTSEWTSADELTWDAWNRLVKVRPAGSGSSSSSSSSPSSSSSSASGSTSSSDSSSSSSGSGSSSSSTSSAVPVQITYQYDALTRRTRKVNPYGPIDYYYDRQWRAVEERVYSTVTASYVWSPVDRWTMIRRKRSVAGTLDETRYLLKDYLDPAAVIDTSAAVVERFGDDAFGPVRFMDASFATRTASALDWSFLFHAEFQDTDSGLYNYGYRYYHPELGRWVSRDPIGEVSSEYNVYRFIDNQVTNSIDLLGLLKWKPERGLGNCLGYATTQRTDAKMWPEKTDDKNDKKSLIDLMKDLEFKCKQKDSRSECKCACNEEIAMMTYYNKRGDGKNPWTDHTFDWGAGMDIHAVYGNSGCNTKWTEILGNTGKKGDVKDWGLFDESNFKILCCCRKKR
jgi:RHS repeat-associated protein